MLDDDEWHDTAAFGSKAARRTFVLKVYSMLTLQVVVSVSMIALFVFEPTVHKFVMRHTAMYIISFVAFLAAFAVILVSGDARKRLPWNLLLLAGFTLPFAYLLGMASAYHDTYVVLMTTCLIGVITFVITVTAAITKVDLTGCGSLLCVLLAGVLMAFLLATLVFICWGPAHMLDAVCAGLVGILFSLYLMFDTQLIMGGKHMELSTDEYVFATIMLFVDIAQLFWTLLLNVDFCCSGG